MDTFSPEVNPLVFIALSSGLCMVCYLLGLGMLRLAGVSGTDTRGIFLSLCCGLSLLISSYALWQTRGRSIMGVVLVAVIAILWWLRRPVPSGPVPHHPPRAPGFWWWLLLVVAAPALICLVRLPILYDFDMQRFGAPYYDYVYYARFNYPLNVSGVETYPSEPFTTVGGPQPYHYYDLWLNALLVKLMPVSASLGLYLTVYSVLLAVELAGFIAIIERYLTSRRLILLLAVGGLCITGVYFHTALAWGPIRLSGVGASFFPLAITKITPIYIFLCLGALLLSERRQQAAAWAWACIPVVFISTAPAVYATGGMLALLAGWQQRRQRQPWWPAFSTVVIPYVVAAAGIAAFYGLQASLTRSAMPGITTFLAHPAQLPTAFNAAVGTALNVAIAFLPFLLLLLLLVWCGKTPVRQLVREHRTLLIFAAGVNFFGTLVFMAFYTYIDALQFLINILFPVAAVVIISITASVLRTSGPALKWITVLVLAVLTATNIYGIQKQHPNGVGLVNHYSPTFIDQVAEVSEQLSPVGAFVFSEQEYRSVYMFLVPAQSPGLYLTLLRNDIRLVSLSQADVDSVNIKTSLSRDSVMINHSIQASAIQQFQQAAQHRPPFPNPELSKAALVRQRRINFVCVSAKGQLPATLRPYVVRELRDPRSGEKLFLLK